METATAAKVGRPRGTVNRRAPKSPTDAWRLAQGLTIRGLAERLGVPLITARVWCVGRSRPVPRAVQGWEAEFPGLFGGPARSTDAKSTETKGRRGAKKILLG